MDSVEEYEMACRMKFSSENEFYNRVLFYKNTKQHVKGLTAAERKRVWRRSFSLEWDEKGNYLLYIVFTGRYI